MGGLRRKRDYTPLSWEDYFDSSRDVCVNDKNVSFVSLSERERRGDPSKFHTHVNYECCDCLKVILVQKSC